MFDILKKYSVVNDIDCSSLPTIVWLHKKIIREDNEKTIYEGEIVNYKRKSNLVLIEKDFIGNKELVDLDDDTQNQTFLTGVDGFQLVFNKEISLRTFFSDDYSKTYISQFYLLKITFIFLLMLAS
jgi:hypothetical protein